MGLEASKRTALRFLETTVTGDIDGLDALLADDCQVFAAGEFATSGWKNKSEFMAHMRRVGGGEGSMFAGSVRFDVGYVTAEDDRVCVEAEIHGPLSGGGEYNNQFHFLFRTRGDQLLEIKEYMDTLHVSRVVVGIQTTNGSRISALSSISQRIPAANKGEQ
jgi:ketosteroid isomerase-like protein